MRAFALFAISYLPLAACGGGDTSDAGPPDLGGHDGAMPDGGVAPDSSVMPDSSLPDASVPDSSVPPDGDVDADVCPVTTCSDDLHQVLGCGHVIETCTSDSSCMAGACVPGACTGATTSSLGCDFWAVKGPNVSAGACFAVTVVNAWDGPAHIHVERGGAAVATDASTHLFVGAGPAMTVSPYDPVAGLAPGQAAIVLLSKMPGTLSDCPLGLSTALNEESALDTSGVADAFHVTTDVPVTLTEMGSAGGASLTTGATTLLPAGSWGTNYVVSEAYGASGGGDPALLVVAATDATHVTFVPVADVAAGGGVPASSANVATTYTLARGQALQLLQPAELTGSVLQADHPVAVLGAHACLQLPIGDIGCDAAVQQLLPVPALGHRYLAASHRDRSSGGGESSPWRILGTVDGTLLTYAPAPPPGAPTGVAAGQVVDFSSTTAFSVESQDAAHPFVLSAYMTAGDLYGGAGDPEWVPLTPPDQFLTHQTFYADPTFPENGLVVVRAPDGTGAFSDVMLGCAGALTGWTTVGTLQYTRVDLSTGSGGVGSCTSGVQTLDSAAPFGVTVWGYGTAAPYAYNSYGYVGATATRAVNTVVVPAVPR